MLHGFLTIVTNSFKGRKERKELEFLHCRDSESRGEGKKPTSQAYKLQIATKERKTKRKRKQKNKTKNQLNKTKKTPTKQNTKQNPQTYNCIYSVLTRHHYKLLEVYHRKSEYSIKKILIFSSQN